MSRDIQLKEDWDKTIAILSNKFGGGEVLNVDAVLYLIGVQELGQGSRTFQKDEKINLIHIAICRLLEPFGYYQFSHFDNEGWPHYTVTDELPPLKSGEQTVLIKEAIVLYFREKQLV